MEAAVLAFLDYEIAAAISSVPFSRISLEAAKYSLVVSLAISVSPWKMFALVTCIRGSIACFF